MTGDRERSSSSSSRDARAYEKDDDVHRRSLRITPVVHELLGGVIVAAPGLLNVRDAVPMSRFDPEGRHMADEGWPHPIEKDLVRV